MPKQAKKVRGVFERPNGSGVWWISYFDQYGRRHREKVGARGAALEAYRKRKTEIREGRFFPEQIVRRDCLFKELAGDRLEFSCINNPRSCRNDKAWMRLLLEAFGNRPVSSITAQEIEQFKDRLPLLGRKPHNPRKPATVKQYLTLLRSTLNLAIRNGKIARSPFAGVRMPKVNNSRLRYLLDEEETRLLEKSPAWLQPIIRFATLSGCRQGEILALTWADVDLEFGAVHVRRSKNGGARSCPDALPIPRGSTGLARIA